MRSQTIILYVKMDEAIISLLLCGPPNSSSCLRRCKSSTRIIIAGEGGPGASLCSRSFKTSLAFLPICTLVLYSIHDPIGIPAFLFQTRPDPEENFNLGVNIFSTRGHVTQEEINPTAQLISGKFELRPRHSLAGRFECRLSMPG